MVKLSGKNPDGTPIYDENKMATNDMGHSIGVIMGKNANNIKFMKNVTATPGDASIPTALGSLSYYAHRWYIQQKYSTLMEIKSLKSDEGYALTLRDLLDQDSINKISSALGGYILSYNSEGLSNYLAADGNITITKSGSNLEAVITDSSNNVKGTETFAPKSGGGSEYNLLLFATGKIVIDTNSDITINGAIISGKSITQPTPESETNTEGIEFKGSGVKNINYDRDLLLNIFKLPTENAKTIKSLLTTKRGIVEMLT
jgi:hypothetical protein